MTIPDDAIPEEMSRKLDTLMDNESDMRRTSIVLSRSTFKLFVGLWGDRFRPCDPVDSGPSRDFRGWLQTPKGEREVWVGFVDDGKVAFRSKIPEGVLL
jgi:hypothetical protein